MAVPLHIPGETEGGQTSRSDEVPDVSEGAFPLTPCLQPGDTGSYPGSLQTHPCQGRNLLPSIREEINLLPRANWAGRRDLSCMPRACCKGLCLNPFLFRQQGLLPVLRKSWGGFLPPRDDGGLCSGGPWVSLWPSLPPLGFSFIGIWGQRLGFCRRDSSFLLVFVPAKTMKVVPQAHEIRCLCEELNSPDTETLLETGTKIAKVTGPKTRGWGPSSCAPARLPAPLQSLSPSPE